MNVRVAGRFCRRPGLHSYAYRRERAWADRRHSAHAVLTGLLDRSALYGVRADFFDAATYPTMSYRSLRVRPSGDGYVVEGDLTLHGVTRSVDLALDLNGFTKDPYGGTRAGFTATTEIDRKDFGINTNLPMDGGGAVVGDKVQISLEIEAILQA